MKDLNSEQQELSTKLRNFIKDVGLPLKILPEILLESSEDCLSWWSRNSDFIIKSAHFSRLSRIVGISEDNIYSGRYDRILARRRLTEMPHVLPERYLKNPQSYLRTSAHIMRYIRLTRGESFAHRLLCSLNLSAFIYEDCDQLINLTYFADLLAALHKHGFSQRELDTLSSVIFLSLKETSLGKTFAEAKNSFDVYSILSNNFEYFDSNFEYKSQFIGKKYVLKTSLCLSEHEGLSEAENIHRLLRYRHILLAWFPFLAGKAPLFAKSDINQKGDYLEVVYQTDLKDVSKPHFFLV